jgi:hypothetical protein
VLGAGGPLDAGRKTAAAAPRSPEAFTSSMISLGFISFKGLEQGAVTAPGNIFVDGIRVDVAAVAKGDFHLFAVKGNLFQKGDPFLGRHLGHRIVGAAFHYAKGFSHLAENPLFLFERPLAVIFDGVDDLVFGDVFVNHPRLALGENLHQRFLLAEPDASGLADLDARVTGKGRSGFVE